MLPPRLPRLRFVAWLSSSQHLARAGRRRHKATSLAERPEVERCKFAGFGRQKREEMVGIWPVAGGEASISACLRGVCGGELLRQWLRAANCARAARRGGSRVRIRFLAGTRHPNHVRGSCSPSYSGWLVPILLAQAKSAKRLALNSRRGLLDQAYDPWRVRWRIARGVRAVRDARRARCRSATSKEGASLPSVPVTSLAFRAGAGGRTRAQTSRPADCIVMARRSRIAPGDAGRC